MKTLVKKPASMRTLRAARREGVEKGRWMAAEPLAD
jgi:hypothetical protein